MPITFTSRGVCQYIAQPRLEYVAPLTCRHATIAHARASHVPPLSDVQDGGGAYVASARLELRDTNISDCKAQNGGAIASYASIVTLHSSSLTNCHVKLVRSA
jgi:hypothetical protein